MSYDFSHLHISDDSIEAEVIESVVKSRKVSPTEAVLLILRSYGQKKSPARRLIGLFSDPAETRILEEALDMAYKGRSQQSSRETGIQ